MRHRLPRFEYKNVARRDGLSSCREKRSREPNGPQADAKPGQTPKLSSRRPDRAVPANSPPARAALSGALGGGMRKRSALRKDPHAGTRSLHARAVSDSRPGRAQCCTRRAAREGLSPCKEEEVVVRTGVAFTRRPEIGVERDGPDYPLCARRTDSGGEADRPLILIPTTRCARRRGRIITASRATSALRCKEAPQNAADMDTGLRRRLAVRCQSIAGRQRNPSRRRPPADSESEAICDANHLAEARGGCSQDRLNG